MKKKNKPPSKVSEMIEMGTFYMMNKKYDKSIEILKEAVEIEPNNAEIYYQLGLIYEVTNKTEDAIEMFQKAISFNPDHKLAQEHLNKLMGIK